VLPQNILLWRRLGKFFEINVSTFLAQCLLRAILPLGAAAALSLLVHAHVTIAPRHLAGFIAEALTFTVVYAALAYWFSLSPHDREDVDRYLRALAKISGSA
jgi:hypothetical protein